MPRDLVGTADRSTPSTVYAALAPRAPEIDLEAADPKTAKPFTWAAEHASERSSRFWGSCAAGCCSTRMPPTPGVCRF